jgi:hypothetical protein
MVPDGPVPMAVLAPWPPSNRGGAGRLGGRRPARLARVAGRHGGAAGHRAAERLETPVVARRQGLVDGLIHEYHAVAA